MVASEHRRNNMKNGTPNGDIAMGGESKGGFGDDDGDSAVGTLIR